MYIFDWDENKNQINQKKHGINFEEASSVFYDEKAILFDDPGKCLHGMSLLQGIGYGNSYYFSQKSNKKGGRKIC